MFEKDSGFWVKEEEKEDKEKMREIRGENISFPIILLEVIIFPLKGDHSKNEVSFQN